MKLTVPNQLTLLRILLTPLFLYYFPQNDEGSKLFGTIIFFVASATDWYDGYIARKFNIITRWGQFMDPLADKILLSSALFILAYLKIIYWWMIIVIIVRDFLITFLRIYALQYGKSVVTSNFAKWKTFLQMSVVFFLLIYMNFSSAEINNLISYPPPYEHWISLLFMAVTLITILSGIQYLIENRSHLIELFKRTIKFFNL